MLSLAQSSQCESLQGAMWIFTHRDWEGFSPWDLIMPLFMFMSGASIPFSMARYRRQRNGSALARRLVKRIVLLWLFGMICQGNLLALDPSRIYPYTNTLQAIAMGYLVASVLFVFTRLRTQMVVCALLLIGYWALLHFVAIDGHGAADYSPEGNLANWVDERLLGRFRDMATVEGGQVVFAPWYHYTWILSSMGFVATVQTGVLAGAICKGRLSHRQCFATLLCIGLLLIGGGLLWSLSMPIVKTIWTSSMVLLSSGLCFVLLAIFYLLIDWRGFRAPFEWLKVYGVNSIVAYMLSEAFSFKDVGNQLLYGLEQYVGNYYPFVLTLWEVAFVYFVLWLMSRYRIYLKV